MSNERRTASVSIKYTLDWTNVIHAIWGHHVRHRSTPFGARSARFNAWIDIQVEHCRRRTAPNIELCRMISNNVRHLFDVYLVQFSVHSMQFDIQGDIIRQSGRIVPNECRTASNERRTVSNGVERSGFHVVKYYIIIFNNIRPNSNNSMSLGLLLGFFLKKKIFPCKFSSKKFKKNIFHNQHNFLVFLT